MIVCKKKKNVSNDRNICSKQSIGTTDNRVRQKGNLIPSYEPWNLDAGPWTTDWKYSDLST